jgi:hypothetical protein
MARGTNIFVPPIEQQDNIALARETVQISNQRRKSWT